MAIYDNYMDPALPGMKADAGFDRVETFAAGGDIPFGVVVSKIDGTKVQIEAGGDDIRGISVHSHGVPQEGYIKGDAVSVMTRGLVWARVAPGATVEDGAPVSVASGGLVSNTGTGYPNAVFRSTAVSVTYGGAAVTLACVELGNPYQAPEAADDNGDQ